MLIYVRKRIGWKSEGRFIGEEVIGSVFMVLLVIVGICIFNGFIIFVSFRVVYGIVNVRNCYILIIIVFFGRLYYIIILL